jgi:NAD(P)-dependent dehydrogenase (short-subunit alcohol dehydrogenase family)
LDLTVVTRPRLLLTGIAEGLGADIAATFASAGYDVLGLSRTERCSAHIRHLVEQRGGSYAHLACDLSLAGDVTAALERHAECVDVLVHNAHALIIKPFVETTTIEFERAWRVACLGAWLSVQTVIPHMLARKQGTIILTGATAGVRGGANFSAFASAKFALRGLAQSLAREFGAKGVHVTHVVLDGLIDEVQTDQRFGESSSGRMSPQAIARAYLDIATQHPSAWTHEVDLRPFSESF